MVKKSVVVKDAEEGKQGYTVQQRGYFKALSLGNCDGRDVIIFISKNPQNFTAQEGCLACAKFKTH